MPRKRVVDDSDKWESGALGRDEKFTRTAPDEIEEMMDVDLGLVQVSLRLQKTLVADLKILAKHRGLGYQPFVRQLLTQYVNDNQDQLKGKSIARRA